MPKIKINLPLIILFILSIFVFLLGNTAVVKKVISGDIIQLSGTFKARLTGIKAPSRSDPLGYKIYDFTKRELEGKLVKIFTWTKDNTRAGIVYDKNGYAFVEIFYDKDASQCFNELLLKKGYAQIDHEFLPDNLRHYIALEKRARENGLGIWKKKD
jgi:endonuclease YncB( thermonuclease family)